MTVRPPKPDEDASHPEREVLFDVLLTHHRSLPPQGFFILMSVIAAISFVGGMVFFLVGAWPVVGFLGADVLLIYLAFKINYRDGRAYETVTLTHEALEVQKVDPRGRVSKWTFQPTWLQVLIDDPPGLKSPLLLRSHGRSLAIGAFLTAEERLELAKALRQALRKARGPQLA